MSLWMAACALALATVPAFLAGQPARAEGKIALPGPERSGGAGLYALLEARRTQRSFADRPLHMAQLGQLLWCAYGVSGQRGGRALKTAPSAGATYPLEMVVVAGKEGVQGLPAGAWRYLPGEHALAPLREGELRPALAEACLGQAWLAQAPVSIVIAADYERCTSRYGQRGVRYTHMESGFAGQNVFLAAYSLGLAAGVVGALDDSAAARVLGLSEPLKVLLVMPVGHPR